MKNSKEFGIYKIICSVDSMEYIGGTTVSFSSRKSKHWQKLKHGTHENDKMQYYWDTYGSGTFSFEILKIVTNKELVYKIEKEYLDNNLIEKPQRCFNLSYSTTGGNTIIDPYVRVKHHIGLINSYTPELREIRRKQFISRLPELKEKMAIAKSRPEYKESTANRLREMSKDPLWLKGQQERADLRGKSIRSNFGEIFVSISAAAKALKVNRKTIRECLQGKRNVAAGRLWEEI